MTPFKLDAQARPNQIQTSASVPNGVFDQAAVQILHLWSYWPKTIDGKAMRSCNVEESIASKLGHDKLVWAYPGHA